MQPLEVYSLARRRAHAHQRAVSVKARADRGSYPAWRQRSGRRTSRESGHGGILTAGSFDQSLQGATTALLVPVQWPTPRTPPRDTGARRHRRNSLARLPLVAAAQTPNPLIARAALRPPLASRAFDPD